MSALARTLAWAALGGLLLLLWATAGDRAQAVERGVQRWREDTTRWLGAAYALDTARRARQIRVALDDEWRRLWPGVEAPASRAGDPVGLVLLRAFSLERWALLVAPLWVAALLDGWMARSVDVPGAARRPEWSVTAARALQTLAMAVTFLVAWPGPLPEVLFPTIGLAFAFFLRAWVRHRPGALR